MKYYSITLLQVQCAYASSGVKTLKTTRDSKYIPKNLQRNDLANDKAMVTGVLTNKYSPP